MEFGEGKVRITYTRKEEKQSDELVSKANKLFLSMPNILDESVPVGKDDSENVEIRKWGDIGKRAFTVKGHI